MKKRTVFVVAGVSGLALVATCVVLALSQEAAIGKEGPPLAADTPRIEGERIAISEAFARRAELVSEPVVTGPLEPVIAAVGAVDFDPEHFAAIGARLKGLVSRVAKFEGDVVEKGALLAVIESPELGEAQAAVTLLGAERKAADLNAKRESELAERNLSTAREAELARVELDKADALLGAAKQKVTALAGGPGAANGARVGAQELRAPISGTIVERNVSPGQAVEGNMVAFKIANLDQLWVELQIYEQDLSQVQVNDRVEISALSAKDVSIAGRVARIGAQVDPDTRSAIVRVEVDNHDRKLRAGQAVSAQLHSSAREKTMVTLVPTESVTYVDGKPTVFVAETPTRIRVARVELGPSMGSSLAVKSGVAAGERVITRGAFALKSELFR